ncbi:interferon-induced very large GTPase 1-like [Dendronephthya gigantea]|uniref:interferon-induced very large GTPase 1-like n=1 Tax=Dendronephthya gigantea TaxID=151771 RepID=UPI00106D7E36|nr:interferon-induced very large GTPase 1-like [Dendronephthya gigantea]
MDAMLEVFHSSDEYLREYLAIKLAACQLSVPFLLPDPTAPSQNVTILLSALKGITKTWKDSNQKNENAFATEYPFPVVSFLRIGQTMSKSSLMNKVMSDAIGYHDYFFQRGMKGGHYKRKTVDGLVELSWFLPAAKKIEQTLKNEICFANLRGDVRYFKKQFNILLKFSYVLCLLLPSGDPEMTVTEVMNEAVKSEAKIILIFKEPCTSDYFNDLERKYPGTFSFITKSDKENKFEFLQSIRECIQQSLHQVKGTPLAELANIAGKFGIFVDGNHQHREVDAIVDSWLHQGIKEAKDLLALQKYVPALAVLEREKYSPKLRASKSKSDHTREEIMNEIYEDIEAEKGAQRESFKKLDEKIVKFLNSLTKMDQTERNRVLSGFKHQLDKMSLADMAKLHQEHHVSRQKEKTKTLQMSDAQSPNQDDLKNIEAQLSEFSFGLEHIIREIAQLHQLGISDYDYAGAAAEMLLSGQPIELLDGDSSYVPLSWFNAVYTKLQRKTNNAKLFVISVLGIQSSGKSTLLNTMFGLEFPVSAGRCTRSAFASLLPLSDSLKSASKFSYVLIIDTEGLRGSADPQLREHDNELATFTIGVSDLTIVNILGANHNEMKEFLEIAVHAFLKMKLVNEKKTCKIVHQNVVATDATDQLIVERSNLKKDLDEMTKLAAREENCDHKFRKLNDIISFNESEDVFYIPGLLTGSPPMAPVNPEYGRAVQEVKENIVSLMCSKEIFRYSISHFRDRVCTLWRAMLKEDFIFTFRNTIEVRAYTSLDRKYFQESVNVMVIGMKQLENRIEVALKRCTTNEELTNKWLKLEKGINREAGNFAAKMKKEMKNFIETSEDNAILEQWREVIMNKIEQEKDIQVMEVSKDCKATFDHVRNLQDVKEKQKIYESELINKAREFITSAKNTEDIEKCKEAFDQEWQKWIQCVPPFQENKIHVEHEMKNVLRETDAHLKTEMSEKLDDLKGLSLSNFEKEAPKIYVEQIGKQEKKIPSARIIRNKAIKEALSFANTASRSGNKCTLNDFTQLYHNVTSIIEKESKNYSIKFSNDLKCNILLHVFGLTYKIFEEMQESYLHERNIRENLEKTLRPSLESRFLNLCETMEKGVLAATSFVDILKAPIKSHLNQWMGQAVAKQIIEDSVLTNEDQSNAEIVRETMFKSEKQSNDEVKHQNDMFMSKGQFHASVLIELGEEGKFERYIPYLENPTEFLKETLTSTIKDYCLNGGNAFVNLLLKKAVEDIKCNVSSAISFADEETNTKDKNLTVWIQKFVEKCSSLPITKDMFAVVTIYDDPEYVDLFKSSIDEKAKLLFEGLSTDGVNEEIFQNWKPSPDEYLLTSMFGCEKFCPFCKGLCDHTDKNHIGDHYTSIHRPKGISGYNDHKTKILSHSICPNSVANAGMIFFNVDTDYKWHNYKDYRSVNEYYKSWNIPDDSSFESSTYWQWFMATFSKDLADHYKVKEPEFPSHWKGHTFEKVKEDLQKEYKLVKN